jgi:adenylate cyclase
MVGPRSGLTSAYLNGVETRLIARAVNAHLRAQDIPNARTMPELTDVPIGAARRSRLAIMFIDIEGFTGLTSKYESTPDVILRMLNVFIPEMMQVVHDYDGAVEKNTGDGIMAYFGTETNDDSVCSRDAVAAAMTMRYVFEHQIIPALKANDLPTFDFRISIDLGEILIGRIGFKGTSTLTAVGGAANAASKILERTRAGKVYIGDLVCRNLPQDWKQFAYVVTDKEWPFVYIGGPLVGQPYPYHNFDGHWIYPR